MKPLFLFICFGISLLTYGQNGSFSAISGIVYAQNPGAAASPMKDIKVMLVTQYLPNDLEDITNIKHEFWNNNPTILQRYRALVCYTDGDGKYEFRGLGINSDFILIICDSRIQLYRVSTGSKPATYIVRAKQLYF